jgi:ADP-ribosyl-[dinitrogen reductase] hydrolase
MSDKIHGMIIGNLLGDSLGAPWEFKNTPTSISKGYTGSLRDYKVYHKDRFGHETMLDFGQITDDGEMTLILAHRLALDGGFNRDNVITDYLSWGNHSTTFAMGRNTRNLFKGITTTKGYLSRYDKHNPLVNKIQSNGSLMRCSPMVAMGRNLVSNGEYMWLLDTEITNPDPICKQIIHCYLCVIEFIIRDNVIVDDMVNSTEKFLFLMSIFDMTLTKEMKDIVVNPLTVGSVAGKTKGWCVYGLFFVYQTLSNKMLISDALRYTITSGGDTDTNAAIVGAVYGSLYGYNLLKENETNNVDVLEHCDTSGGNKLRPDKYVLSKVNIKDLSDKLAKLMSK